MRLTLRRLTLTVLLVYIAITCYSAYILIKRRWKLSLDKWNSHIAPTPDVDNDFKWNPWGQEFEKEGLAGNRVNVKPLESTRLIAGWSDRRQKLGSAQSNLDVNIVEIWGKAAISLYLWEHILKGPLERKLGGIWSYGEQQVGNIIFRFRTGPGVVPAKVPKDVRNLVLVLNGREPAKVEFATMWLDYLPNLPHLQRTAVVLLGNEQCDNHWIHKYLERNGGSVQFVFLVYDSPEIDDHNFYQWPLGVATYREFPVYNHKDIDAEAHRVYKCNFLGSVYPNSSRETLISVIHQHQLQELCYINPRREWLPQETEESRRDYIQALLQSDLTLCPVGKNSECYRLYEAFASGSVPVVEDRMTPGHCGKVKVEDSSPLRLLKKYNTPVIYVSDWSQLADVLQQELYLSREQIQQRRKNLLLWYEDFKLQMSRRFVDVINRRFFSLNR